MTINISPAANTVVPAILALQAAGFQVQVEEHTITATSSAGRFMAEDPVAVLGLITLVELRGPDWSASDEEIEDTLARFNLI